MKIGHLALLAIILCANADAADFDFRYVAKIGYMPGDSLADIYLDYMPAITPILLDDLAIPVPQTRRLVGQFVLKQRVDGKFDVVAATAAQVSEMKAWPAATGISTVIGDFNRDRESEILLKNVSSAIAGASNQLIFAPLDNAGTPIGVRGIDNSINKFATDLMGSANDPNYFASGWHVVRQYTVQISLPTYRCAGVDYYDSSDIDPDPNTPGGPDIPPGPGIPNGGQGCIYLGYLVWNIPITEWEWDSTGFSSEAFVVYRSVGGYYSSTDNKTIPAERVNAVLAQFANLFGTTFTTFRDTAADIDIEPPEVFKRPQPWWLKEILRVITVTRVVTTVGGLLYPESTTSDDTFEQQFHYGFKSHAPLFASGIKAWLGKPAYVTPTGTLTGLMAQDLLALPIKDTQDSPPDARYIVDIVPSIPRSLPGPVAARTWTGFGLTRHRTGNGIEILLFAPTGPGTVYGPFSIDPF